MRPGDIIADRYRIEAVVGVGGMGVVHRAVDLTTGVPIALKTLLRAAAGVELGRFSREAQVLAQLDHPSIVSYRAHDLQADPPWLAMEWLEGEDLAERLTRGPLPTEEALRIAREVLGALAQLHGRGIVHRDLKPSNIFLLATRAKLIDLGVARLESVDATALTRTGGVVGTPLYMSPEQARGELADERADVWAMGAVLFEMIAGAAPFDAATALGVLSKILMGDIPRLAARVPGVSASVDYAVERALSRDLSTRPANANELLSLLTTVDVHDATVAAVSAAPERRLAFVLFVEPSNPARQQQLLSDLVTAEAVQPVRGGFLVARFGVDRLGVVDAHLCARAAILVRRGDPGARVAVALARTTTGASLDDVLDQGARMIALAEPGELVADADTAAVLGALLKETRVRVLHSATSSVTTSPGIGPLVGRESELSRVEGICRTICDEQSPSAVLVVGEPGLGKTRLTAGLKERLDAWPQRPVVLSCGGEPLLADAPFASLRVALEHLSHSVPSAKAVIKVLEDRATRGDDGLDPERWRAHLGTVFEAWARSVAATCFLVVELDDVHWIDSGTVDLATRLLGAADLACLLLATARPEIDERVPPLFGGLPVDRIDLRPLSAKAAERLVRALLPSKEGDVAALVARAGGNPLFLRELTRVAPSAADALPTSLAFLIQLRLDALPTSAREVCRVAATFGDHAWLEGIEFVLGRPCAADVVALQRADIQRTVPSSIDGATELAFRHALFRETAERMAVDVDARAYQKRIFEWLRPRTSRAEVLAHHAEKGGLLHEAATLFADAGRTAAKVNQLPQAVLQLTRALDAGMAVHLRADVLLGWLHELDDALVVARIPESLATLERVLVHFEKSANIAEAKAARLVIASAISGALEYVRADELFAEVESPDGVKGTEVVTPVLRRVLHWVQGARFEEGRRALDRIADRVPQDQAFDFWVLRATVRGGVGDAAGAIEALDMARRIVPDTPAARVSLAKSEGMTRFLAGDELGGAARSIEGATLAGAAGFAYQEALLLHNAGDGLVSAGDDERARETLRRSLAIATANRFDMLAAYNSALLSYLDLDEDPPAHLRTIEKSTRFVRAVGSPWAALSLQLIVARATLRCGKRAAARELAQRIHSEASSLGYDRGRVEAENLLAEIGTLRAVVSVPPAATPGQADGVIERVRQGHRWTPEEANEFLVAFHAARPGVTARAVRGNHTAEGLTSYDLTASYVPGAARIVVDVACGDGALLLAVARRLTATAEVVGVDLSAVDLELARRRLGTTRSRLLCENAERTSLAASSADAVVSHYALMLMRPIDAVLTEAARVLRPGGVFVACVPGGSVNRSPTEARQLLLDAIRADVPLYPDTGLGDSRVHDDSAITALLADAGFEGVRVDSHVIECELTPTEAFAEMRDYYWWDLIRDETRSRLERELMPLLMNEAAASGRLRRATQLRMIVAQRPGATS